jgi:hypothetical protein
MIFTYHNADTRLISKRGKEVTKPSCVVDYNHNIGAIDFKDQLLNMYLVERKIISKWYMKLFKCLLNCSVMNSMILFRQVTGQNINHLSYRVQLLDGLFNKYAQERSGAGRRVSDNTLRRLRDRHFIRKVTLKSEKYRPQRRCVVCMKHGR